MKHTLTTILTVVAGSAALTVYAQDNSARLNRLATAASNSGPRADEKRSPDRLGGCTQSGATEHPGTSPWRRRSGRRPGELEWPDRLQRPYRQPRAIQLAIFNGEREGNANGTTRLGSWLAHRRTTRSNQMRTRSTPATPLFVSLMFSKNLRLSFRNSSVFVRIVIFTVDTNNRVQASGGVVLFRLLTGFNCVAFFVRPLCSKFRPRPAVIARHRSQTPLSCGIHPSSPFRHG